MSFIEKKNRKFTEILLNSFPFKKTEKRVIYFAHQRGSSSSSSSGSSSGSSSRGSSSGSSSGTRSGKTGNVHLKF